MSKLKSWIDRQCQRSDSVGAMFRTVTLEPGTRETVYERIRQNHRNARLSGVKGPGKFYMRSGSLTYAFVMTVGMPPIRALSWVIRLALRSEGNSPAPDMTALVAATDWFPSPKTRKLLKKMVVEQATHIESLVAAGRPKTARWIWFSTWFLLIWYGVGGLITSLAKAIRGKAA